MDIYEFIDGVDVLREANTVPHPLVPEPSTLDKVIAFLKKVPSFINRITVKAFLTNPLLAIAIAITTSYFTILVLVWLTRGLLERMGRQQEANKEQRTQESTHYANFCTDTIRQLLYEATQAPTTTIIVNSDKTIRAAKVLSRNIRSIKEKNPSVYRKLERIAKPALDAIKRCLDKAQKALGNQRGGDLLASVRDKVRQVADAIGGLFS